MPAHPHTRHVSPHGMVTGCVGAAQTPPTKPAPSAAFNSEIYVATASAKFIKSVMVVNVWGVLLISSHAKLDAPPGKAPYFMIRVDAPIIFISEVSVME